MPSRNAPTKEVQTGIVTLPSSATALTTKDTYVKHINFCNTTGGAVTVTVSDTQSPVKYLLNAKSIAANDTYTLSASDGDYFVCLNGLKWNASAGSSIDAEICAFVHA